MSYKVEILKGALKQLKKLSPELQERIQLKIDELAIEPRSNGSIPMNAKSNNISVIARNEAIPAIAIASFLSTRRATRTQ